jgi:hypothetical protein
VGGETVLSVPTLPARKVSLGIDAKPRKRDHMVGKGSRKNHRLRVTFISDEIQEPDHDRDRFDGQGLHDA